MNLGLAGRRALVLGAGGVIGRAVAHELEAEGARITVVSRARRPDDERFEWVQVDIAEPASRDGLIERMSAVGCDILISLAAAPARGDLRSVPPKDLDAAMQVKVWGPAILVEALAPAMAQAGWGRILLTSGVAGREPMAGYLAGGIANAAVRNLVKGLGPRWAAKGVTVNAICPGPVRSARLQSTRSQAVNPRQGWMTDAGLMPAGRYLEPQEVARVIVFLVSDAAAGINGTEVVVDGGATLGV